MASRCSLQVRGVLALLPLLNRGKQGAAGGPFLTKRPLEEKSKELRARSQDDRKWGAPVDSEGRVNGLTIRNLP